MSVTSLTLNVKTTFAPSTIAEGKKPTSGYLQSSNFGNIREQKTY
jgi:hypothetical protein